MPDGVALGNTSSKQRLWEAGLEPPEGEVTLGSGGST